MLDTVVSAHLRDLRFGLVGRDQKKLCLFYSCVDYIIDTAYEKGMMIILNPSPYDSALDACDLSKVSLFLVNEIEGFQITGEKEPEKDDQEDRNRAGL